MQLTFYKYQGTGNDFVMIDGRQLSGSLPTSVIVQLCNRRFGIGADGLIVVQPHAQYDFEMIYYNADGSQSLCGNGSRCAMKFANELGLVLDQATFLAYDGPHYAFIETDLVHFKMAEVHHLNELSNQEYFINTGSPHHVRFVNGIEAYPVFSEGQSIRNAIEYKMAGTNVNFVELQADSRLFVRTYERGVEDETLSCGTGVTASALAYALQGASSPVQIATLGGQLQVSFKKTEQGFADIYLIGPAEFVFEGIINL